jgi:hypothetical protein
MQLIHISIYPFQYTNKMKKKDSFKMNINSSRRVRVKSKITKKQSKSSRYMSIPMKMASVAVLHGLMTPHNVQRMIPLMPKTPKRATQIQQSMSMSVKSSRPLVATQIQQSMSMNVKPSRPLVATQIQQSMSMNVKPSRPLVPTRSTSIKKNIPSTVPSLQPLHVIKVEVSVSATGTSNREICQKEDANKTRKDLLIPGKEKKPVKKTLPVKRTPNVTEKKVAKQSLAATSTKKATIKHVPKPTNVQSSRILPRIEKRVSKAKVLPIASKYASQLEKRVSKAKYASIYVLELEGGFIYVGKSNNVEHRINQHMNKRGAVFTRMHPPTGKILCREGSLEGDGDGPERDETLRQMHKHGPRKVRGWKYCNRTVSSTELKDIESNIREMLDLCRICGGGAHFAAQCKRKRKCR